MLWQMGTSVSKEDVVYIYWEKLSCPEDGRNRLLRNKSNSTNKEINKNK
jgi:hypothetical protein